MTMKDAVKRLIRDVGLDDEQALQLTMTNPRRAIDLE
jgi:N-acetylglucosamine-6-phosphate deacetylase